MKTALHSDFLVIGSGIAGLSTALGAAQFGRTLLVTKGTLLESNTFFAQGGIAAALGPGDTPEAHHLDTLLAGAEMCEPQAVRVLVEEAPRRIRELIARGTRFDREPDGTLALAREGAHSRPRILHARGDATGAEIASVLASHVRAEPNITVLEHTTATDLIVQDGRCIGCWLLMPDGKTAAATARACVLATGGVGQLYKYTTNPWVASAAGPALAYRAGAALIDMEFIQFHPTALAVSENPMVLVSEAVRGEGALLVDDRGERFMVGLHPLAELAPRDIVARAIFERMQAGRKVFLDATAMGSRFEERFPTITRAVRKRGLDPARDPIPVTPAAHFIMGGVLTDTSGRTTLPGLYACGETAWTGVHGANRLASNSLSEGLVFSERITQALRAERSLPPDAALPAPPPPGPEVEQPELEEEVKTVMWQHAGLVRSEAGLTEAEKRLIALSRTVNPRAYRVRNMVQTALCIVRGALMREESRGGHFRQDHPEPRAEWRERRILHSKAHARPTIVPRSIIPADWTSTQNDLGEETE
ncbi:MAG: L-aspartate oxidase [Firmicutes bacterium]|nr:L-aspartate oxidase [Bacillota bacterium]